MKKGIIFIVVLFSTVLLPAWTVSAQVGLGEPGSSINKKILSDVTEKHWAYKPIKKLLDHRIIMGYPDGSYKPQKMVQRNEFATMLASVAKLEPQTRGEKYFADVPAGVWYEPAVETVRHYMPGSKGSDGKVYFKPHDIATRQDVINALVKVLKSSHEQVDPRMLQEKFVDYTLISQDARAQVTWAVQNNLINGFPDGTFRPQEGISRAEVAAILYRAYFIDTSIKGLIENKQIMPITTNASKYKGLIDRLSDNVNYKQLNGYNVSYFAQDKILYNGDGPQVLYIFGRIDDEMYFRWEADFKSAYNSVRDFNEGVALEAARLYPQKNILVMFGHTFNRYFDVSDIYDNRYLKRTDDGWQFNRYYTGIMVKNGMVTSVWVDELLSKQQPAIGS